MHRSLSTFFMKKIIYHIQVTPIVAHHQAVRTRLKKFPKVRPTESHYPKQLLLHTGHAGRNGPPALWAAVPLPGRGSGRGPAFRKRTPTRSTAAILAATSKGRVAAAFPVPCLSAPRNSNTVLGEMQWRMFKEALKTWIYLSDAISWKKFLSCRSALEKLFGVQWSQR